VGEKPAHWFSPLHSSTRGESFPNLPTDYAEEPLFPVWMISIGGRSSCDAVATGVNSNSHYGRHSKRRTASQELRHSKRRTASQELRPPNAARRRRSSALQTPKSRFLQPWRNVFRIVRSCEHPGAVLTVPLLLSHPPVRIHHIPLRTTMPLPHLIGIKQSIKRTVRDHLIIAKQH